MSESHGRVIPILALAMAGCLWGTGFFFGKMALTEMPVAPMILFRLAFACIGLLPTILWDRPHFAGSEWGWVFLASVLGVPVLYLVQFKGLSLTSVSHASLMVGTLPMLLAAAAVLFSGERMHFGGWLALAASTVGAALIALSSKTSSSAVHPTIRGDLLVVLSMFAAIAWILISKRLMRQHSALTVTGFVYWIGTLVLALVVVITSGVPALHYSTRAWIAVAEQGFFATAGATVLWNWGLKRAPASQAGIFVNLEPLVGAILGVLLLHESLGKMAGAGGALIIGGAVYFSYKPERIAAS
ncbi:MAG TPA: EamA family transporter [Candidatus Solibacter sp.]|nr:EamA family transporter [Candidatus Solibacter sp.]